MIPFVVAGILVALGSSVDELGWLLYIAATWAVVTFVTEADPNFEKKAQVVDHILAQRTTDE